MKKRLIRRFAALGAALMLSTLAAVPTFAATVSGHLDVVADNLIAGWAWDADAPDTAVTVELSISKVQTAEALDAAIQGTAIQNTTTQSTTTQNTAAQTTELTLINVSALMPREDLGAALGSANHGFAYLIDWSQIPGETFTVTASAVSGDKKIPLIGSFTYTKPAAVQLTASSTTQDTPVVTVTSATPAEAGAYLGEFTASGYCNCTKCSGGYTKTFSGTIPQANHTLSADITKYPIGTRMIINGIIYTVEDRGSSINDNRLDIFFSTHAEALAFGLQKVHVYAVK